MKLAVVCASGIGDALIFEIISHAARSKGWEATTFSNHLAGFGKWLPPNAQCAPQPRIEELEELLSPYDAIFLQHDNSPKAFKIKSLKIPVHAFYGAHLNAKHGLFDKERDYLASRSKTMVANVSMAALQFFGSETKGNGFVPPPGLIHRRFKRRIAIHPTASSKEKIWPKDKFLRVSDRLQKEGYDPVFTVAPHEQPEWGGPLFHKLEDLASFIYESGAFLGNDSGTGHLASLLNIPHLIIAGDGREMPLWRTGWHPGALVAPPPWLMQFKHMRKFWKTIISENKVIKNFKENTLDN